MKFSFVKILLAGIFMVLGLVVHETSFAQASCDQAMSLSKTCGSNSSCLQRAGDLFNQCAKDKRNRADTGTSCRDRANACAYRCGDSANYTSGGSVSAEMSRHQSCLQRCSDAEKVCKQSNRKNHSNRNPAPSTTSPGKSNTGSYSNPSRPNPVVRGAGITGLRKGITPYEVIRGDNIRLLNANVDTAVSASKIEQNRTEDQRRKAAICLLYTSPSPRDRQKSRMPSSA